MMRALYALPAVRKWEVPRSLDEGITAVTLLSLSDWLCLTEE